MEKKNEIGDNLISKSIKLILIESFCFDTFFFLLDIRFFGMRVFLGFISLIYIYIFFLLFSSNFALDIV